MPGSDDLRAGGAYVEISADFVGMENTLKDDSKFLQSVSSFGNQASFQMSEALGKGLKSGVDAGQRVGVETGEGFFDGLKGAFGRGSDLTNFARLLNASGPLLALGILGREFKEGTALAVKLVAEVRSGAIGWADVADQIITALPALGDFYSGVKNITGETARAAEQMRTLTNAANAASLSAKHAGEAVKLSDSASKKGSSIEEDLNFLLAMQTTPKSMTPFADIAKKRSDALEQINTEFWAAMKIAPPELQAGIELKRREMIKAVSDLYDQVKQGLADQQFDQETESLHSYIEQTMRDRRRTQQEAIRKQDEVEKRESDHVQQVIEEGLRERRRKEQEQVEKNARTRDEYFKSESALAHQAVIESNPLAKLAERRAELLRLVTEGLLSLDQAGAAYNHAANEMANSMHEHVFKSLGTSNPQAFQSLIAPSYDVKIDIRKLRENSDWQRLRNQAGVNQPTFA